MEHLEEKLSDTQEKVYAMETRLALLEPTLEHMLARPHWRPDDSEPVAQEDEEQVVDYIGATAQAEGQT